MLNFNPETFKYIILSILNFEINYASKNFLSMYFFISNYLITTLFDSNNILKTNILSTITNVTLKGRTKLIEKGSALLQKISEKLLE